MEDPVIWILGDFRRIKLIAEMSKDEVKAKGSLKAKEISILPVLCGDKVVEYDIVNHFPQKVPPAIPSYS